LAALVDASDYYTGAEIESSIEAAMYEAFSDNRRDIITEDVLLSLHNTVPISKLMKEEISALRRWASERARNASKSDRIIVRNKVEEEDL
jgi:SpoVK/Ycf46/Vps4 family AAA+-type ATPase